MTDNAAIAKTLDAVIQELHSLRKLVSQGEPAFPPEARKHLEDGVCLLCHQPLSNVKSRPSRGNHELCYKKVKRAIDAGDITEFEAVEQGILAPAGPGGRRPKQTAIRKMIEKARQSPPSKPIREIELDEPTVNTKPPKVAGRVLKKATLEEYVVPGQEILPPIIVNAEATGRVFDLEHDEPPARDKSEQKKPRRHFNFEDQK